MNQRPLSVRLYNIYHKGGQYAVYRYAEAHPKEFEKRWTHCEPCEDLTPTIKGDDSCAVCGTRR